MVLDTTQKRKSAIVAHDLWKKYDGVDVLRGLNLEVFEGETVVILGRSGVGKSVLLRQLLGLEVPDKGYVEINGERISDMRQGKRYRVAKNMGMLFQNSALFDSMTVGENAAFYLRQHMPFMKEKEVKERVANALEIVHLQGIENKLPGDLSGGMRKRVALARLIVYEPKIVLYDEPTSGLDPITAMQINDFIKSAQQKLQATSIVVTHDIRSALEVGDRLAFHDEGKIMQIAPKDEFLRLKDPLLKSFFENAMISDDILASYREKQK